MGGRPRRGEKGREGSKEGCRLGDARCRRGARRQAVGGRPRLPGTACWARGRVNSSDRPSLAGRTPRVAGGSGLLAVHCAQQWFGAGWGWEGQDWVGGAAAHSVAGSYTSYEGLSRAGSASGARVMPS